MNIRWDTIDRIFIAEFSSDFHGDLSAVKAAGFRTDGPPLWRWYAPSPGIKALNRLRANRPFSGLTISPEALGVYTPLAIQEEKNDVVKKQLAKFKKAQKKEVKKQELQSSPTLTESKIWIGYEDLPAAIAYKPSFVIPPPPDLKCGSCGQPVYFYELPALCLWCEKNNP
jgi:hypothetical protein